VITTKNMEVEPKSRENRSYETQYVHGTAPEEQDRLSLLNELINNACLRELKLSGGEKVLDVGSGLGQFTRLMARTVGSSGQVVGVEGDPRQIREAVRCAAEVGEEHLVELREGDAYALPLRDEEWGSFDVVYARFLLEHVSDPLKVVRQMVRAARRGGRIVLADDDHDLLRFWPEAPAVSSIWKAYARTYDRLGNDPYVGRRLVSLLHEAGARPKRNTWVFFGSCAGGPHFDEFIANIMNVLVGARDTILVQALVDPNHFDESMAAFRIWAHRPDAALWYAICWAEGEKKLNGG
jgi:ubiquinone/menaquinone biosynthesis C-methylase UbiE